jgi:tetratricopeptide (TPR) repeat protein
VGDSHIVTKPHDLAAVIARVSQRYQVPRDILLAIVAPVVKDLASADLDGLERKLTRKVPDIRALRTRLAQPSADAALAGWRQAAAAACEAGHLGELDKALAQAELHILGGLAGLAELPGERRIAAGEVRADRGTTSLLQLAPEGCREASRRFAEAAAIVGLADPERSHELALRQADALSRIGEEFSDRTGYEAAIAHLRTLLSGLDNFDDTVRWAATQERLGLALVGLGALTGDTALPREAASSYRTTLEDLRKDHAKPLWIRLQRHLGTLALQFGEADGNIDLIEEAVDAFRAAGPAIDREADAPGWARTQFDLGRALSALGWKTSGMASLEAAFNAFQAASEHWTREASPERWADIQDRMGSVLVAMGGSYSETVVLEEAVAAFGRALEVRQRETAQLLWARSSANQGEAMMLLARRRKDLALAQQALAQMATAVEAAGAGGNKAGIADLQKKLVAAGTIAQNIARAK